MTIEIVQADTMPEGQRFVGLNGLEWTLRERREIPGDAAHVLLIYKQGRGRVERHRKVARSQTFFVV